MLYMPGDIYLVGNLNINMDQYKLIHDYLITYIPDSSQYLMILRE